MKNLSLYIKILVIFFIPVITLTYLSFSFVQGKYKELHESSMYTLSATITLSINNLIHNLQRERGLSAGLIHDKQNNENYEKLLEQYKKTDEAYNDFLHFINLKSSNKDLIEKNIELENKPLVKDLINKLSYLSTTRENILNTSISFEEKINYYTVINHTLIKIMYSFITLLNNQSNENSALYNLQQLQEYSGLERAYIFNQLISNSFNTLYIRKIKELLVEQEHTQGQFFSNATINSLIIYNNLLKKDKELQIKKFRENFFKHTLDSSHADEWFKISSDRIDVLDAISMKILNNYITVANETHSSALRYLYVSIAIWVLSLLSLMGLTYILNRLIKKEEKYTEELRISAYTFDSHEAMTITDVNGTILKVNDGFTKITGYLPSEVIGKNPRVLKSMKHDEEFYKEMWRQIHTIGKWSNDIYNKRKNGEIYLERLSITAIKDDKNITTHYIAQFLDISDVVKAQKEAQHQADHDFLTGLLNRKSLMQRLNEEFVKARRHNFLHAFLFIDIDEFKTINDSYGHDIGDKLLIEISQRLKSMTREEDIVSRISGDEFAIVILNIDKTEAEAAKDVKEICMKMIETLRVPFIIKEHKLNISASIGIKLFPDGENGTNDVIIRADTAMYQAKNQGKNQFVFFDRAIELELKRFQLLEEELNHAYDNNEFKFFYQAKIDTISGEIVGAEALVRWEHPEKGLLYPVSFLKVASEIGMIPKITNLALHSACKFIKENEDIFEGVISINIDSNELLYPEFEQNIISTIKEYNINPKKLELEITESELIKDFDTAIIKIKKLREFGILFAIDDFGTGYSSITYLQKLPVNSLKIDRSFLTNTHNTSNQEIVKMIVNMAKTFNMCSIVEGVEDESQLEFIKSIGAQQYQGYLFSKAIDEESFKAQILNCKNN